jgi:hypothetical protein
LIAAAIVWQSPAGVVLVLMVGRVTFLPNSPDASAWTPLNASLSSGTRFQHDLAVDDPQRPWCRP